MYQSAFGVVMDNPQSQWLTKANVYFFLQGLHLSWAKLDSTSAFILKLGLKSHLLSRYGIAIEESSQGSTIK